MKITISSLSAFFLLSLLLPSCQKEDKKNPVMNNKPAAQSFQQSQKIVTDNKDKLKSKDKGLAGAKDELEKEYRKADRERRQRENRLEVELEPLTEEDQKFVENVAGDLLMTPEALESRASAKKYIEILLKGNHKSIRWSRSAGSEDKQKSYYDETMAAALSKLDPQNIESINIVVRVINTRSEYPKALAEAASLLGGSGDNRAEPLLEQLVKNNNSDVRLSAGQALLLLDCADTALPVLDSLIRQGHTAALGSIFHNMIGKQWQQRGLESIKNALSYDNEESKILAALFLIRLTKNGIAKENVSKLEKVIFKTAESIINKNKLDKAEAGNGKSDYLALESAIIAFRETSSQKAIPLLERLREHPDASYLKKYATDALKELESIRRK